MKYTKKAPWVFVVLTAMVILFAGCRDPNNPNSGAGIRISVEAVTLSETGEKTLNVSDSFEMSAEITPPDASDKGVIWRSLSPSVVAVFGDGLTATVLGVAPGTTIIMVVTEDGGKIDSCTVTVP